MEHQTNIVSPPAAPNPPPHLPVDWLVGLEAGTDLKPSFFRAENRPQRVVVMGFTGFGAEGKQVELHQKDAAGNPIVKKVPCFCEVQLQDAENGRAYVWQVLSRPTVAKLRRVLADAGPACFGVLEVDIHAAGKGLNRETFIVAVPTDIEPEMSTGAGQARDDDAKELREQAAS